VVLRFIFVHVENRVCLSCGVQVAGVTCAGSDKDRDRSRRPGAEDRGWSSTGQVLDGRTIRRSDDAVCGLYHAHGDEERVFLG
jgi:hypothetical protein